MITNLLLDKIKFEERDFKVFTDPKSWKKAIDPIIKFFYINKGNKSSRFVSSFEKQNKTNEEGQIKNNIDNELFQYKANNMNNKFLDLDMNYNNFFDKTAIYDSNKIKSSILSTRKVNYF